MSSWPTPADGSCSTSTCEARRTRTSLLGTEAPLSRPGKVVTTVEAHRPVISLMLAVAEAPTASAWYKMAVGAKELWNLGSVVGLEIDGAPFFLAEPEGNGWADPTELGTTTVRIEVFVDDPDAFIARAIDAGADVADAVTDHQMPWGCHRQGGFVDPYGHRWLVGDVSPLLRFPR